EAVRKDGADGLADGNLAESHAPASLMPQLLSCPGFALLDAVGVQRRRDLRQDRDRDLGGRDSADRETDGPMDAGQVGFPEAGIGQASAARGVRLPRAKRA